MAEKMVAVTKDDYESAKIGSLIPSPGWHVFTIESEPEFYEGGKSIQVELQVDEPGTEDNGKTIRFYPSIAGGKGTFKIKELDAACGLEPVFKQGKDKKMHLVVNTEKYVGTRIRALIREQANNPGRFEVGNLASSEGAELSSGGDEGGEGDAPF